MEGGDVKRTIVIEETDGGIRVEYEGCEFLLRNDDIIEFLLLGLEMIDNYYYPP